jgi:hypothetical protein
MPRAGTGGAPILTYERRMAMRRRRAEGASVRTLAREFDVTTSHVSRLLRGQHWPTDLDPTVPPPARDSVSYRHKERRPDP